LTFLTIILITTEPQKRATTIYNLPWCDCFLCENNGRPPHSFIHSLTSKMINLVVIIPTYICAWWACVQVKYDNVFDTLGAIYSCCE
jgi:hypothetical protein